jgi:hypothetical protein
MRTFFGLTERYKKGIYEEFFLLKQYGNWSFWEVYNLPVLVRKWFLKRLTEEKENERKTREGNK